MTTREQRRKHAHSLVRVARAEAEEVERRNALRPKRRRWRDRSTVGQDETPRAHGWPEPDATGRARSVRQRRVRKMVTPLLVGGAKRRA